MVEDVDWSEDEQTIVRVLSPKSHKQHASGKVRKGGPRRSASSDKRSINQMYILSLKMTFQEISLRRTCIINVLEERELGKV